MSTNSEKSSGSGFGIGGVVFLIFMVLKLAEIGVVAKWSWWWVTSPLWGPLSLMFIVYIIYALGLFVKEVGKKS